MFQTFNLIAPIIFILLFIFFYLYTDTLLENKYYSLLATILFSVSLASLYHTIAGEWRGEELSLLFLFVGLYFINKMSFKKTFTKTFTLNSLYILLFLFSIILLTFSWNGAIFSILLLLIAFIVGVYYFITDILQMEYYSQLYLIILMSIIISILIFTFYFSKYQITSLSTISETSTPSLLFLLISTDFILIPFIIILLFLSVFYKKFLHLPKNHKEFFFIVFTLSCVYLGLQQERFVIFLIIPLSIIMAWFVKVYLKDTEKTMAKSLTRLFILIVVPSIILYSVFYVANVQPADNLNANFYSALYYLKNNTNANATVLSLWADGSVIENIANRRVYSDSMAGGLDMPQFAQFLYTKYGNFTYLYQINATYLLVRRIWLNENVSIFSYISDNNYTINFNETNFYHLVVLNESDNNLSVVFKNNDTTIYKVEK